MVVFTSEVNQNEFLPEGGTEVHAVVTVTATGNGSSGGPVAEAAEVILLDCSASMESPYEKIREARRAACAAIDALRDGVAFAVVAGTTSATMAYPTKVRLVAATEASRAEAKAAVGALTPHGGTAIGRWLLLARDLMATRPTAIHHAILLTDGKNQHETPAAFAAAVAACEGRFQCDCRGVGADWVVAELRQVATTLLGSVELLREPAAMADDFRAVVDAAMGRSLGQVTLRMWTPKGAKVRFLRQVLPEVVELAGRASAVNALTSDYPTGAWGDGTREYHVCVEVPPGPIGAERLAARISLVVGDDVLSEAKVRAVWTEDVGRATMINGVVAHYTGQVELARAVQAGLEAREAGDDVTAATALGRAAQLAAAGADEETLKRLRKVVEIDDAATGAVRLRKDVTKLDEMDLDVSSTRTVPAQR